MAYFWNHQNPPQQPNQPAVPDFPLTMFGTMHPLLFAQIMADTHNTIPPFPPIFPFMSQQAYIDHARNFSFMNSYGVTTRPRSNYDIPTLYGRGGGSSTNVNSEGRPNSSGHPMVSQEDDDALMMSVLDESINQENPSPTDGLSLSIIARNLKTRDCNFVRQRDDEDAICVVCQDGLCQENEKISTLDCGHEYHQECIGKWLLQRNFCPVCKATAIHLD